MKNYSIRELILVAILVGFLIVAIFSFFSFTFITNFFDTKLPIATSTPKGLLDLKPSKELYKPLDFEEQVIQAVKTAAPAVVAIIISKNVPIIEQCPYDPFSNLPPEFRQFFGQGMQFYQPCQKGTKLQEVGGGSGFIVSNDGVILTNKHVVQDKTAEYTVFTNDGKKYPAKILARDPNMDIAIVKIEASNLPKLKLGNSDSIQVGQIAIAIGNALGEFKNTVNMGIVSGLSREITASGGGMTETIYNVIQTDASINSGNSGGPLLNLRGEVMGINTAIAQNAQSIGFAIPVNQVKKIVNDILNPKKP